MNLVQEYICNCEHAITNIINAITYEKNKLERFTKNKEELNEASNCYKYTAMIKWLTNGKIITEEVSNYINNSILCKFGELEGNGIDITKVIILGDDTKKIELEFSSISLILLLHLCQCIHSSDIIHAQDFYAKSSKCFVIDKSFC